MRPLVSVIIPTYNCAAFVEESIRSVLDQSYRRLECIVIDDGSTDDTPAVLAAIDDPRLVVIRTENRGISAARNTALDHARGDYIAFQDADDRWCPGKLERQVAIMEAESDVVAVFTNLRRFDGDADFRPGTQFDFFPELARVPAETVVCEGRKIMGDAFAYLIRMGEWPTWTPTVAFRASAVRDLRFRRAQNARGEVVFPEDGFYCFQAFRRGAVAYLVDPLVEVRRHATNSTKGITRHAERKLAMLRALTHESLTRRQARAVRRRMARALVSVARYHAEDGHPVTAVRALAEAMRCGLPLAAAKQAVRLLTHRAPSTPVSARQPTLPSRASVSG